MESSVPPSEVDPRAASAHGSAAPRQEDGTGSPGSFAAHEDVLAGAERALDEVDRALVRLDDGTYRTCEVCGGAIDDEALAATPTVRTCRAHLPLADRT